MDIRTGQDREGFGRVLLLCRLAHAVMSVSQHLRPGIVPAWLSFISRWSLNMFLPHSRERFHEWKLPMSRTVMVVLLERDCRRPALRRWSPA